MRGLRLIAVVAIFGVCLAMPSLLAAQETPPAEEAVAQESVADDQAVAAEEEPPQVDAVVVEEETDEAGAEATAQASQDRGETQARQTATASATTVVDAGDFYYKPKTVHIEVGDTVTWKNVGQAPHTSTANDNSFDTGVYDPGESRSHTFTEAGTIDYICTLHPQMTGTVVVAGASGADPDEPTSNDDEPDAGADGGTSVPPAETESAAVESASAAGTDTSLPATGEDTWLLALTGLELLAAGFLLGRLVGARVRP